MTWSRTYIYSIGAVLLLGLVLVVLSSGRGGAKNTGTMHVAATVYPLAFVAAEIGGAQVTVSTVTPAGAEPHDFEPSPQDVVGIESADMVIMSGTVIDAWATKLQPDLDSKHIATIVAAHVVTLATTVSSSDAELPAGAYDPHFWQDPTQMSILGRAVAVAFTARDPAHEAEYAAHLAAFEHDMNMLDQDFHNGLKSCATRDLVVSHDAFRYLARRYGLVSVAIAGVSPDEEPSSQQLAAIVQRLRSNKATTVFFEPLVSPALANTIAAEAHVATATLNPIEGLTPSENSEHKNYSTIMRENLSALRAALVCK